MKADSIAYVIAGMCFGVILGWVIGTQQARRPAAVPTAGASTVEEQTAGNQQRQAPPLDEGNVQALTTIVKNDPKNLDAVLKLANTYFDAEHWDEAIQWYQRGVELDPKNPDSRTDLGISLYQTNRLDEALTQFEQSLKISPQHSKAMLHKGIVLAFGKRDLKAAATEWEKVVTLAPDSAEGQAARRALESISAAHGREGAAGNP